MNKDPAAAPPQGPGRKPEKKAGKKDMCRKPNGSLKESAERFRKIFENSPIGMALVAPDLRFSAVNPAWIAMTGYSEEELLQLTVRDITHPDHFAGDFENIQALIAGTIPVYCTEKRYVRKDGSILWGVLRVTAIRDDKGVFRHLAAQIEDITIRKQAESALRESEIRFREQYQNNPLAIFTWQHTGDDFVLVDSNTAADILSAGRSKEYLGKKASELYSSRKELLAMIRECFTNHRSITGEMMSEHFLPGRIIRTKAAFVPPDLIMVHMEDITERKVAEKALLQKTALLEAQLDSSNDGILVVDEKGSKVLQNQRTVDLWKIPRTVADDPDDGQQIRHVMNMTKDPEAFVRKVTYLYEHPDETSYDIVELIDGTVLERYSSPVLGRDGKNYGRIWNFRDITERRKEEEVRERLIAELAQKNTELDRFTFTVSHDLKSPLLAIRAFLSLLNDDLKAGDSARAGSDVRYISESAEKLENLINSLLTLSRSGRTVSTPLPVSLQEVVQTASGLLGALIQERGVELVVEKNLPVVMGDRERLLQVMTNLLDNAIKFLGDQEHPKVEVGVQQEQDRTFFFVRDNGSGIERADLSRVFGLYERLNPDVPGTGIGLATVKRIIEAHGGEVRVESEGGGKGTTFFFTLPVAQETPDEK